MVKIRYVKAWPLAADRPGVRPDRPDHYLPYWRELAEAGVRSKYYAVLVEIGTGDGLVGWGESIVRESPAAHVEIINGLLAPIIVGKDALAIENLWQMMYASLKTRGHFGGFFMEALSGIDLALWDIAGKHYSQPTYRLLGGPIRDRIKAYASSVYWHYLGKSGPEAAADEAERLVSMGHDQIKVKIGMEKMGLGKWSDRDLIRAIRDRVGYDVAIMVDANSAYSVGEAIRVGRMLERYEVLWFEEPLPLSMVDGYAELCRKLDIMIAGGESLFSIYDFQKFIKARGLNVVQPDIARCGGITGFRKIAALCEAEGLLIAPHIGLSGPGCRAGTLHMVTALPIDVFLTYEYMYKTDNPIAWELPKEVLERFSEGYLELPNGPGLGFEPKPDILEKLLYR